MNIKFKTATDFRKSLENRLKSFALDAGVDLQRVRRKVAFDRPQGVNTRVKDLIDMVLLTKIRGVNFSVLKEALQRVFKIRDTHLLPKQLEEPPSQWQVPYTALAHECELTHSLSEAFVVVADIYTVTTSKSSL